MIIGETMTREQHFFVEILSDFLNSRKTEAVPDMNWKALEYWAQSHQVQGIVFYQCRNFLPADYYTIWEQSFFHTLFLFNIREATLKTIYDSFCGINIPLLVVKGLEISKYYPVPSLRTMGDIDILVHKDDKTKAGHELEKLGFIILEKNPDYDWVCELNGLHLELHHNLLYLEAATNEKHAQFFNDFWKYDIGGKLDPSFHFLFILVHTRKHILNSGAGFRMFMDIASIIQKDNENTCNLNSLNWTWIQNKLVELDMLEFSNVCFSLIEEWFGIQVPIEFKRVGKETIFKLTCDVFNNGIFGYENKKNTQNNIINNLLKEKVTNKNRWIYRTKIFFGSLFPSYNNMANSPYYHFVRGRKWLLPVAWTYRIYRMASGKTPSLQTNLQRVATPERDIVRRENELHDWGLW